VAPSAQALVLCADARQGVIDGALAVRQTCRSREVQVDPAALGLQGPPGPALVVVDANGAFVGTLNHTTSYNSSVGFIRVARSVAGRTVLFWTANHGFTNELFDSRLVSFESIDCSGPPLIVNEDNFTPTQARVLDTIAFYRTGPIAVRTVGSELTLHRDSSTLAASTIDEATCLSSPNTTFTPPNRCCRRFANPFVVPTGAEATVLDLTTLDLVPPFHVEGP
jgi:hypothetical protein